MKYLAVAAAALFLFAAPGASFAQSNNGGGDNGSTNTGGNGNGGGNVTGTGSGAGSDTTGSVNPNSSKAGSCSKQAPGSFNSFNEECRREIDIWAQKQNGKGIDYSGDLAEGVEVPGTVEFMEVPAYPHYGYAMLNGKRVLIDRDTRKVVHVY